MKIRVIENSWFAQKIIGKSITLYPFIFLHIDLETAKETKLLNHEFVHIDQIEQLGIFRFYLFYVAEFLYHLYRLRSWERAYLSISFEKEAYYLMHKKKLPPGYE